MAPSLVLDNNGRIFRLITHGYLHYQMKLFDYLCKLQSNINNKSWGKKMPLWNNSDTISNTQEQQSIWEHSKV
jgi:hypothetical protein